MYKENIQSTYIQQLYARFLQHAFQAALRDCGYTRKITSQCFFQVHGFQRENKIKIALEKKSESQSEKSSK